jgi:hypothetical protein
VNEWIVERTVTFKREKISGHDTQIGLDTKTDWLTDSLTDRPSVAMGLRLRLEWIVDISISFSPNLMSSSLPLPGDTIKHFKRDRMIPVFRHGGTLTESLCLEIFIIFFLTEPSIRFAHSWRQKPKLFPERSVQNKYKKFWEELTAYFPFIRHGPHRKRHIQNSCIACVFVTAVTFLPSRCLETYT